MSRQVISRFAISFITLLMVPAFVTRANAVSLLQRYAVNNVSVTTEVEVGFDGAAPNPLDFDSDSDQGVAEPVLGPLQDFPAFQTITPAPPTFGKDKAEGSVVTTVEYGTPVPGAALSNDEIRFTAMGTVSSVDGHNLAGNPANAVATANGTADFFLDADFGGSPRGVMVGTLELLALRTLQSHETLMKIEVFEDLYPTFPGLTSIAVQGPGDPSTIVDLIGHSAYRIEFQYAAEASFGTDPPFSVELGVGIIPEPSSLSLAALGALALIGIARRPRPRVGSLGSDLE